MINKLLKKSLRLAGEVFSESMLEGSISSHALLDFRTQSSSMSSIKRDVKKKAPPRPEDRGSFSRSSPLLFRYSEEFGLLSILVSFLWGWCQSSSVQDAASRTVATMVLSEARGLSLFLVIRGGIACNG